MIKFDNLEVVGWEHAIRGMRNPLNSWAKGDSRWDSDGIFRIGNEDLNLMRKLCKAGTDHRKFMRMLVVYMDITAPLDWWKQYDTYKVGTVANSCSTMHKLAYKEFELTDFSCEELNKSSIENLTITINALNLNRELYLKSNDKRYWKQMERLLPQSYNQKRTVMLNYEVLANMYGSRKNHKLDEWNEFCDFIKTNLPCSELITGEY